MWIVRPFIELFCEVIGKTSRFHRQIAESLRREKAPRSRAVFEGIAALHAPWWGFAAWGAVYAMTVMAIVAVFFAAFFETMAKRFDICVGCDSAWYFWLAAVVTAPFSFLPFRRWMRRRRRDLLDVARDGLLVSAEITKATLVTVHEGFSIKGAAHSTHLTIKASDNSGIFHGYVGKGPAWAAPGQSVEIIRLPAATYGILLCPDGGTRPLKLEGNSPRAR